MSPTRLATVMFLLTRRLSLRFSIFRREFAIAMAPAKRQRKSSYFPDSSSEEDTTVQLCFIDDS